MKAVVPLVDIPKGRVNPFKGHVDAIKRPTTPARRRLNRVKRPMNAGKGRSDAVKGPMNAVRGRLNAIKRRVSAVKGPLNAIEPRSDVVKGCLNAIEAGANAVRGRVSVLRLPMNSLDAGMCVLLVDAADDERARLVVLAVNAAGADGWMMHACVRFGVGLTAVSWLLRAPDAYADPQHPPAIELAGSVGTQHPLGNFGTVQGAPGGVDLAQAAVDWSGTWGLTAGFDYGADLLTRVVYEHGSIVLGVSPRWKADPVSYAMEDVRLETAWRPEEGLLRPYASGGVGYRWVAPMWGPTWDGGYDLAPHSVSTRGALALMSVGAVLRPWPRANPRPYFLATFALEVTALRGEEVRLYQQAGNGPLIETIFGFTQPPQTWVGIRLEVGFDLVLEHVLRSTR